MVEKCSFGHWTWLLVGVERCCCWRFSLMARQWRAFHFMNTCCRESGRFLEARSHCISKITSFFVTVIIDN